MAILRRREAPTRADFHDAISSRADRWYSVCLRITRNRDMAEDAVQDALLSAWNKRQQFDHSARLDTWIHRIAVNSALQLLRKSRPGSFEPLDLVSITTGSRMLGLKGFKSSPDSLSQVP